MKLIMAPDPFLEHPVNDFDFDTIDAKKVEAEMVQLMLKEHGVGLSANQVGVDGKIFVMKAYIDKENFPEPFAVINPVIEGISQEIELGPEGCLSHPKLFLKVKRPKAIRVKFLDSSAKECKIQLNDFDARIFLHEYDHLHGIDFTNRVSKLKLEMARKKQKKSMKRTING
jgi:peptide deformylase